MRMCLGKILLQDPDVLLLDEPTNHLDLDAIEWLEGYVKELEIPTVIVSHDREFLDQVPPANQPPPAAAELRLMCVSALC
jgi:ATPase subunit of ABC transporter with duplicated ATPase domains